MPRASFINLHNDHVQLHKTGDAQTGQEAVDLTLTLAPQLSPTGASFHRRLAVLSSRSTRAGRRLALWLPTVGALLLCILAGLGTVTWWLMEWLWFSIIRVQPASGGSDSVLFFLPVVLALNILVALPRCFWLIARGATLFDQQYARTWRRLKSTDLAVLFADELYWEVLQRNLALPLRQRVGNELGRRMIERQLETAAAFHMAFEDLQRGTGHLRRVSLARGMRMLGQVQAARFTWLVLLIPFVMLATPLWIGGMGYGPGGHPSTLLIALPFLGSLIMAVSLRAQAGPTLVQFHATLAALADFLSLDDCTAPQLPNIPPELPQPVWWRNLCNSWLRIEEGVRVTISGRIL